MSLPHETLPVQVWVDVDRGIAAEVRWLNSIPGVRTFTSCQGTIGEGGPHPYRAQVMAWWPEEKTAIIERRFEIGERGTGWAYIHPKAATQPIGTEGGKP